MSSVPSITFVCCVEAGPLEAMCLRLIESLRRNGGHLANAAVLAVNPRFGPPVSGATRRKLAAMNARYLHLPSRGQPYVWYHFMNKVRVMDLAERELIDTDLVGFLDSDMVVLGEPGELLLDDATDVAACNPDNSLLASTTGPGHEREKYWRRICDVLGLEIDVLPWIEAQDGVRIRFYLCSAVFAYRRSTRLGGAWLDACTRLLDANVGIGRNGEHWLEQASLGLAIARGGLRWTLLSPSHNSHILAGEADHGDPARLATAKILHYHDSMSPAHWNEFLRRIAPLHPAHHAWLEAMGPVTTEPAPHWKVLGEILRATRGVSRRGYRKRYAKLVAGMDGSKAAATAVNASQPAWVAAGQEVGASS